MSPMPKLATNLRDAQTQLGNAVYQTALLFERYEHAGLWRGNGHHAAQAVSRAALGRLAKDWKGMKE